MGGGNRPLFAVRSGANGDITLKEGAKVSDAVAWSDLKAGPTFKELGRNALDGMCWSSPAVGGGAVFLRTVDTLYCLRAREAQK
jgi:hypothetical protein